MNINRRTFMKLAGYSAGIGLVANGLQGCAKQFTTKPTIGRVVVIGGGYAGNTAAKYIRMWSGGTIEVIDQPTTSRLNRSRTIAR